jgi:hypothetical protein
MACLGASALQVINVVREAHQQRSPRWRIEHAGHQKHKAGHACAAHELMALNLHLLPSLPAPYHAWDGMADANSRFHSEPPSDLQLGSAQVFFPLLSNSFKHILHNSVTTHGMKSENFFSFHSDTSVEMFA